AVRAPRPKVANDPPDNWRPALPTTVTALVRAGSAVNRLAVGTVTNPAVEPAGIHCRLTPAPPPPWTYCSTMSCRPAVRLPPPTPAGTLPAVNVKLTVGSTRVAAGVPVKSTAVVFVVPPVLKYWPVSPLVAVEPTGLRARVPPTRFRVPRVATDATVMLPN